MGKSRPTENLQDLQLNEREFQTAGALTLKALADNAFNENLLVTQGNAFRPPEQGLCPWTPLGTARQTSDSPQRLLFPKPRVPGYKPSVCCIVVIYMYATLQQISCVGSLQSLDS